MAGVSSYYHMKAREEARLGISNTEGLIVGGGMQPHESNMLLHATKRSRSSKSLLRVFSSERLAYSDGCIVFGESSNRTANGGRIPSVPQITALGRCFKSSQDAAQVEAVDDINKMESRHPTLPFSEAS